ncbi:hypothetical protein AB0M48_38980 [Lentzea sp. NPDC051208]|uniref:hypothetical protein n=1 Tax=Lentzea sp. NPDC051208 TaxID=3154642 RepID=UPI00342DA8A6
MLTEDVSDTKQYAAAMRQAHQVVSGALGRQSSGEIAEDLATLSSVDAEIASSLIADLAHKLGTKVDTAAVLASQDELRALVELDLDATVEWLRTAVALTEHFVREADNRVKHAEEEIGRLSSRNDSKVVADMVAQEIKGVYLAVTGPFAQIPPVELTLAEAEDKLAPLKIAGGLPEAVLRAYRSPDRRETLLKRAAGSAVELILDADWVAWIMVDLREVNEDNREVWKKSASRGMSYDEARKGSKAHIDCLIWESAVIMRLHDTEFWSAPYLWPLLEGMPGVRSGTLRKVGNDVPAWDKPKVLLLEGGIATDAHADLLTTYVKHVFGSDRKAVLRLQDKAKRPWSRTGRAAEEGEAGAKRPVADKGKKRVQEARRAQEPQPSSSADRKGKQPAATAEAVPRFKEVWADQKKYSGYLKRYRKYIVDRLADESLDFLEAVRTYRAGRPSLDRAEAIYHRFVEVGSEREINVDMAARLAVRDTLRAGQHRTGTRLATVFDDLEKAVINLLDGDMSTPFRSEVRQGKY